MRHWRIHMAPGSHFDYGWAASPGECLCYLTEVIRLAVEDLKAHADFRFTVEYALFMKHFLEVYPEYLPAVKTLLKEGRLEVCSTMTGPIEQWLDGEMLIHQFVRAKRWLRETLDYDAVTAQHTDLPGHVIQIAQFLRGAEILHLAYSRHHPPTPLHRWRSPDGSEVVACCHNYVTDRDKPYAWEGYGWGWALFVNNADTERIYRELPAQLALCAQSWPQNAPNMLMGCQSDLQPSDPAMIGRVRQWNARFPEWPIRLDTITGFFKAVNPQEIPAYQGEAPYAFFALPSVYIPCAQAMRRGETAIASAEKWSVFGWMSGLGRVQKERITRARDAMFLPHDHNTGGRRGEINDEERLKDALTCRLEGESLLQEAAMRFTVHIGYPRLVEGTFPITVFNSLSWDRDDVVETYVETPMTGIESLNIVNSRGKRVPSQIVKKDEQSGCSRIYLVFVAKDVPAHGYETFYVRPSTVRSEDDLRNDTVKERDPVTTSIRMSRTHLRNRFFDIRIRGNRVRSVMWRDRELVGKGPRHFNEVYMVEDRHSNVEAAPWEEDRIYTGKQWDAQYLRMEIVEQGPVRGVVRFSGTLRGARFTQDVMLYEDLERVDFRHVLHYKMRMHTMTRVAYPLLVPRGKAAYESPYGVVRMPEDEMPNTFRGTGERWVQKWADISNRNYGVTLATGQACHVIREDGIEPILVRTAVDCGTAFYYFDQNRTFTFDFALHPHGKNWKRAATRAGWEFNYPLYSCNWTTCFPIKPVRLSKGLSERDSFLRVSAENVVVTAVAPSAEQDDAFIVRLVEYHGVSTDVLLECKWPLTEAEEVNFLERVLADLSCAGNGVRFRARPYGIHTIRLKPAHKTERIRSRGQNL